MAPAATAAGERPRDCALERVIHENEVVKWVESASSSAISAPSSRAMTDTTSSDRSASQGADWAVERCSVADRECASARVDVCA